MPSIVLENFKKSILTIAETDGKKDSVDFLISSSSPFYSSNVLDSYFPLTPWSGEIQFVYSAPGYAVNACRYGDGIFFITSQGYVYKNYQNSTYYFYDRPISISGNYTNFYLTFFNNNVVWIWKNTSPCYRKVNPSDTWTSFGSFINPQSPLVFNNLLMIVDQNLVRVFDANFNQIGYLTVNGQILKLVNFNNAYVVIVVKDLYPHVLFWNGDINSNATLKIKAPSNNLLDVIFYNGTLLAFTQDVGISVYQLYSNSWRLLYNFRNILYDGLPIPSDRENITQYNDYIVLPTNLGLLFINPNKDEVVLYKDLTTNRYFLLSFESLNSIYYGKGTYQNLYRINPGVGNGNAYYKSNIFFLGRKIKIVSSQLYYKKSSSGNIVFRVNYIDEEASNANFETYNTFEFTIDGTTKNFYIDLPINVIATKFYVEILMNNVVDSSVFKRAIINYEVLK